MSNTGVPKVVSFGSDESWVWLELVLTDGSPFSLRLSSEDDNPLGVLRYEGVGHGQWTVGKPPEEYYIVYSTKDGERLALTVAPENPSDFHEHFFMRAARFRAEQNRTIGSVPGTE